MQLRKSTSIAFLSSCLLSGALGTAAGAGFGDSPVDRLALEELTSKFHEAGATGDEDLLREIFAADAVVDAGGQHREGRDQVVDFFASPPTFGEVAALTASYKSIWEVNGDEAFANFECIIVHVDGSSPLTTPLSSLPPGSQNPAVEIIQHSNASITAARNRGRWEITSFTGRGGAIQP